LVPGNRRMQFQINILSTAENRRFLLCECSNQQLTKNEIVPDSIFKPSLEKTIYHFS